jgi:hypothetical protein
MADGCHSGAGGPNTEPFSTGVADSPERPVRVGPFLTHTGPRDPRLK